MPGDVRGDYDDCDYGHCCCCGLWVVFHYAVPEGEVRQGGMERWLMINENPRHKRRLTWRLACSAIEGNVTGRDIRQCYMHDERRKIRGRGESG